MSGARSGDAEVTIGILALQGAFAEHESMLRQLRNVRQKKVVPVQVRTTEDLERCDALIIPGGESTTIALLIRLSALHEPIQRFLARKPVWGTCAGAILLSSAVVGSKKGGQELLCGMDVTIERNGWGSQVESFEASLDLVAARSGKGEGFRESERDFHGVFIRAPVVLSLSPSEGSPPIEVISRLPGHLLPTITAFLPSTPPLAGVDPTQMTVTPAVEAPDADLDPRTIVALRQGRHMLTTFHPELTADDRFHEYFVRECVLGSP